MAPPVVAPPGLQEATRHATLGWQDDLKALFDHTKVRFPDVVWELLDENDNTAKAIEEVWGHKGERSRFVSDARARSSSRPRVPACRPTRTSTWPTCLCGDSVAGSRSQSSLYANANSVRDVGDTIRLCLTTRYPVSIYPTAYDLPLFALTLLTSFV